MRLCVEKISFQRKTRPSYVTNTAWHLFTVEQVSSPSQNETSFWALFCFLGGVVVALPKIKQFNPGGMNDINQISSHRN